MFRHNAVYPMKLSCIASILLIVSALLLSCDRDRMSNDVISQNDIFTVTGDSVVEGPWSAIAISPTCIKSSYSPPDSGDNHGVVKFRLAINGHDNEMAPCYYHYATTGSDTTAVTVGVPDTVPATSQPKAPMVRDHDWVVRVDMRPVVQSLDNKGYYVTATGDTVYADEFKGVWIAGNVSPLSWDFLTLSHKEQLRLQPTATAGIYEIKLHMQPSSTPVTYNHVWKVDRPDPDYAVINTGVTMVDALYNMSIYDIERKRHGNGHNGYLEKVPYGANPSYSIILSLAYLDPEGSMRTLRAMVGDDGSLSHLQGPDDLYPIVANDLSWAVSAWEIYAVTGSKKWLRYAYGVIRKTVDQDYDMNCDMQSGLVHGGLRQGSNQSQSYPAWMEPKDVYETQSLTVNLLYERAFEILSDMGDELDDENSYGEKALTLKENINETLWNERHGYYSQYLYMSAYPVQSPGIDNLGQSLSVLWNVADDDRAVNLVKKTPIANYGVPIMSPRYDNGEAVNLSQTVSPVVQAFWNLAAAKTGNQHMLRRGLGALYRAAALFGANRVAWDAYSGKALDSTDGDLGAAAANAAMVYRVYAGMTFLPGGIEFNPTIPSFMKGIKHIYGFKYRNATLDITISGTGNDIDNISIDNQVGHDNFFSGQLSGHHTIHIKMRNSTPVAQEVTLGDQNFTLPATPVVKWLKDSTRILNYNSNLDYRMVVNGQLLYTVNDSTTLRHTTAGSTFTVSAIAGVGRYALSYLSKPYMKVSSSLQLPLGANAVTPMGAKTHSSARLTVTVPVGGDYLIDLRYANGNAATAGSCPVYMLYANTHAQGALVMPPRGNGEWMNKGWSNMITAELLKGDNHIELKRLDSNGSTALVYFVRIIKK